VNVVHGHDYVNPRPELARKIRLAFKDGRWYGRDSPIIDADLSLNGPKAVAALERAAKYFGYPRVMQVDNATEFQSVVPMHGP
jgi:hypothetical protein